MTFYAAGLNYRGIIGACLISLPVLYVVGRAPA